MEELGNGIQLEMVAIPAGSFIMGSPEDEPERSNTESPQHEVPVSSFFMGRYPVTQAQWRSVAGLPQVNRDLKLNPSRFNGDRRPVEQVSWYDAVEFCDRLSAHTGREYRFHGLYHRFSGSVSCSKDSVALFAMQPWVKI